MALISAMMPELAGFKRCSKPKLRARLPCTTLPFQLFYYSTVAPNANVSVTIETRIKIKVMHLQAIDITIIPGIYQTAF